MNNDNALNAFTARIDNAKAILEAISSHLEDHLGVTPEEVNWAHAGDAHRMEQKLQEIADTFQLPKKPDAILLHDSCSSQA